MPRRALASSQLASSAAAQTLGRGATAGTKRQGPARAHAVSPAPEAAAQDEAAAVAAAVADAVAAAAVGGASLATQEAFAAATGGV